MRWWRALLTAARAALPMATERILSAPRPLVSAIGGATPTLVAPNQLLLTGEDYLRVRVWCSQPNVTVTIETRFMQLDGKIQASLQSHLPTSDRAPSTVDIKLAAGYLLNVVVRGLTATLVQGQCYATVSLVRGDAGAAITLGQLLAGYVTTFQMLGWPGSPITPSTDGAGWLFEVTGGNTTFDQFFEIPVPAGARWRLNTLSTVVSAGATAGDRQVVLQFQRNGFTVFEVATPNTFPALSGVRISYGRGLPIQAVGGSYPVQLCPLPLDVDLRGGSEIQLFLSGYLAGDQYVQVGYQVTEWLEAA